MVGWPHLLNGHEFEQAPAVGDGQGNLECCSSWGCKELDTTERLNCICPVGIFAMLLCINKKWTSKNILNIPGSYYLKKFCVILYTKSQNL